MTTLSTITLSNKNNGHITDFAAARNRELAKAESDWVLFVDQDEVVSRALHEEIDEAIKSDEYVGYTVRRIDTFMARELLYGETSHVRLLRLAKRDAGKFVRPVHEVWEVQGKVGELRNPLHHHPHESINAFLAKIDQYSTIEAKYRYGQAIRASLAHIAIYPLGKFVRNYLVLQGFRDGVPGVIMAMMMSFHSYLTWTKLYLLWLKK